MEKGEKKKKRRISEKDYLEIRGELLKKGENFSSVADKFGVSRSFVLLCIRGDRDSELAKEIRETVYKIIGRDMNQDTLV